MHQRVQRIGGAIGLKLDFRQECVREPVPARGVHKGTLEYVVQQVHPGVSAQELPEHLHQGNAQLPAVGQVFGGAPKVPHDAGQGLGILRVPGEVLSIACRHARVGGPVHGGRVRVQGGEPAGDQAAFQGLRGYREVGQRAEAAVALAEGAPRVDTQFLADGLRITHNRIGAEVGEVGCLRGAVPAQRQGLPVGGGAQPGATLVKQQDAEGLGSLGQPA